MKVLVADFDKTFSDDYDNNIEAVNKFVEDGNVFIIATGRGLESLKIEMNKKNIKYNYLICNDGAVIYNEQLEEIYKLNFEPELVKKVYEELIQDKNISEVYFEDGYSLLNDINNNVTKVIGRFIKKRLAFKTLNRIIAKIPNISGYVSTNWVVINNEKVSKGNAIEYLANKYNFSEKDIYTVGDNYNDISMNKKYNGYAMAKANRFLKKASKGTVKSVSELIKIINQKY